MARSKIWGGLGGLSLTLTLGACSDDTVNLGGGQVSQEIQRGARCMESPVIDDSVSVLNQQELADLAGCEEIAGDLRIQLFAGADLAPLAALRVIGGTLELGGELGDAPTEEEYGRAFAEREQLLADGYLPSLAGLESLEQVAILEIYGSAVETLESLGSLRRLVGRESDIAPVGSVRLSRTRLRNLHGLENVEGVRYLSLRDNAELESLDGLRLEEFSYDIAISYSPKLGALPEVAHLGYVRSIYLDDVGITDLDDFESLYSVDGSIVLRGNRNLANVDRLAGVTARSLRLEDNALLKRVPPLSTMEWLESVSVLYNPSLESLSLDLPLHGTGPDIVQADALVDPIKVVDIGGNDTLRSVSLAAGLEQGRFVAIYQNPSLESVSLGTLAQLEELRIVDNSRLGAVDVGALQSVQSLTVTGNTRLDTAGFAAIQTFEATLGGNAIAAAGQPAAAP